MSKFDLTLRKIY